MPAGLPVAARAETHVGNLFRGIYLGRTLTVWALWFCTYVVTFGMLSWLPTVWTTVYHMPPAAAFAYQSKYSLIALPGFLLTIGLIDLIGRRRMFMLGLGIGGCLMLSLGLLTGASPMLVLILASFSQLSVGMLALALSTYTAELYPTELRALGSGFGNAWLRIGSTAGPLFIGADAAGVRPPRGVPVVRPAAADRLPRVLPLRDRDERPGAGAIVAVIVLRVEPVPVSVTGGVGRA